MCAALDDLVIYGSFLSFFESVGFHKFVLTLSFTGGVYYSKGPEDPQSMFEDIIAGLRQINKVKDE